MDETHFFEELGRAAKFAFLIGTETLPTASPITFRIPRSTRSRRGSQKRFVSTCCSMTSCPAEPCSSWTAIRSEGRKPTEAERKDLRP